MLVHTILSVLNTRYYSKKVHKIFQVAVLNLQYKYPFGVVIRIHTALPG